MAEDEAGSATTAQASAGAEEEAVRQAPTALQSELQARDKRVSELRAEAEQATARYAAADRQQKSTQAELSEQVQAHELKGLAVAEAHKSLEAEFSELSLERSTAADEQVKSLQARDGLVGELRAELHEQSKFLVAVRTACVAAKETDAAALDASLTAGEEEATACQSECQVVRELRESLQARDTLIGKLRADADHSEKRHLDHAAHADEQAKSLQARDGLINELTSELSKQDDALAASRAATAASEEEMQAIRRELVDAEASRRECELSAEDSYFELSQLGNEVEMHRHQVALDIAREVAEAQDAAELAAEQQLRLRDDAIGELSAELAAQAATEQEQRAKAIDVERHAGVLGEERQRLEQHEAELAQSRMVAALTHKQQVDRNQVALEHEEAYFRQKHEEELRVAALRVECTEEQSLGNTILVREQKEEIEALDLSIKTELQMYQSVVRSVERRGCERRCQTSEIETLCSELREHKAPNLEVGRLEDAIARRDATTARLRESMVRVEAHAAISVERAAADADLLQKQLAEVEQAALDAVSQAEHSVEAQRRKAAAFAAGAELNGADGPSKQQRQTARLEKQEMDASVSLMRQVGARVRDELSTALAVSLAEDTPSSHRFRGALLGLSEALCKPDAEDFRMSPRSPRSSPRSERMLLPGSPRSPRSKRLGGLVSPGSPRSASPPAPRPTPRSAGRRLL